MNFHPNIPSLTPCLLHGWLIVLKSQGSEMKASNASLGTRHRLEPVAPMVLCRSGAEKTLIWLWFSLVILSKLMLCPTLLYKNIHGEFPLSLKSLYNELAIYLSCWGKALGGHLLGPIDSQWWGWGWNRAGRRLFCDWQSIPTLCSGEGLVDSGRFLFLWFCLFWSRFLAPVWFYSRCFQVVVKLVTGQGMENQHHFSITDICPSTQWLN